MQYNLAVVKAMGQKENVISKRTYP